MKGNFLRNIESAGSAGPGHWNDPDMLEIGLGHLNNVEERTHMALWAYSKAPLIIGADLNNMTEDSNSYKILTDKYLLSVNQDDLGNQATLRKCYGDKTNFCVYRSLVRNDGDTYMAYLMVNWDDQKIYNYAEIDPVTEGIAEADTNWCTYVWADMSNTG